MEAMTGATALVAHRSGILPGWLTAASGSLTIQGLQGGDYWLIVDGTKEKEWGSFDLTVTSLFVPLITGRRVVIYPQRTGVPSVFTVMHDNAVDVEKIHAELKDGVLRVSLPKAEALKPRKIAVN